MDVIYPYLRAPEDFELRYSLRSLANMTHDRVIVAGDRPAITSDRACHIPVPRMNDRYRSSTTNILSAVVRADVTDKFVVMHDDIFLLKPWADRHQHRATIAEYLGSGAAMGTYRQVLRTTYEILRSHGISDPLFFGMHTPCVYEASKFIDLVNEFRDRRYLTRTLYFNLFPQPSMPSQDVKLKRWRDDAPIGSVLSISDDVARSKRFRSWIDARFSVPSEYERQSHHEKDNDR